MLLRELREAWSSEPPGHRGTLIGVILVGLVVRLAHLAQPIRYDEAVTWLYFARLGWADALSTYTYPNNHLFHTALVKLSAAVFGSAPWALRVPAFLAGIACIPATYVVVRELYGGRVALVAAGLVAASGGMVLYSTNARGYTIVALAFLLAVLLGLRILRDAQSADWLGLAFVAAIGLWTVPVMLFPLGAAVLWLGLSLWYQKRRDDLRRMAVTLGIAGILTLIAYAPVIAREGAAAVTRNRFVAPTGWYQFLSELPASIGGALSSWGLGIPPVIGVALLVVALYGLRHHARVTTTAVGLPLATFVWCSWLLVVTHRAPFARVWLWALPLVAALAGAGVVLVADHFPTARRVLQHRFGAFVLAFVAAASLSVTLSNAVRNTPDTGTFRDAAAVAERLATVLQPGDRVHASIPSNAPLQYHLHRRGLDEGVLTAPESRARRIIAVVDAREGQTLRDVVERSVARDSARFSGPRLLGRIGASAIYLFERRNVSPR